MIDKITEESETALIEVCRACKLRPKLTMKRTRKCITIMPDHYELINSIAIGLEKHGYALIGMLPLEIYAFCIFTKLKHNHEAVKEETINSILETIFADGRKNVVVGKYLINKEEIYKCGLYRFIPRELGRLELDWGADKAGPISLTAEPEEDEYD